MTATAPSAPHTVPHLSPSERAARGKAARAEVPRSSHAEFGAARRSARPGRAPRGAGRARGCPSSCPIRYGRMLGVAVRLLPRRRRDHGRRPRRDAALGPAGPALRRRAPVELRRLRLARARSSSSTSTTSTRRCPARGSGTSSGWPPASRSPAATAGSTHGRAPRDRPRGARGVPRGDARVRRPCATSTSGTRTSTSTECSPSCGAARGRRAERKRARARPSPRRGRKDSLQALAKLTARGRRRAADRQRPAADRPDRGAGAGRRRRGDAERAASRELLRAYRRHAAPTTAAICSSGYRYVDLARKVVGVGSVGTRAWIVLLLGRDGGRPAVPPGQGGAARPCSSRYLGAEPSTTNHGQRVVEGQRLMQAASDIFLGWQQATRPRRPGRATSTSASCGTGRARRDVDDDGPARHGGVRRSCAAGPSPARTPARATAIAIAAYLGRRHRLRQGRRELRRGVRRPERARLRGARRGGAVRPDRRRRGPLSAAPAAGRHPPSRPAAAARSSRPAGSGTPGGEPFTRWWTKT